MPVACEAMDSSPFERTTWVLTHLASAEGVLLPALPEARATIEFADGRIGGSASCNRFTTTGPLTDIPDTIAITMMMCPEPIMEQEQRYLFLLPRIEDVRLVDDDLIAQDANGADILVWRMEDGDDE